MQNANQLATLIQGLPKLPRLSLWFRHIDANEKVLKPLVDAINQLEDLKWLDLCGLNTYVVDPLGLEPTLARLEQFSFDLVFDNPNAILAATGPNLKWLSIVQPLLNRFNLNRLLAEHATLARSITTFVMQNKRMIFPYTVI